MQSTGLQKRMRDIHLHFQSPRYQCSMIRWNKAECKAEHCQSPGHTTHRFESPARQRRNQSILHRTKTQGEWAKNVFYSRHTHPGFSTTTRHDATEIEWERPPSVLARSTICKGATSPQGPGKKLAQKMRRGSSNTRASQVARPLGAER